MQKPVVSAHPVEPSLKPKCRLTIRQRAVLRFQLIGIDLRDYFAFDSLLFQKLVGTLGLLSAMLLSTIGRARQSFVLLCKLHRANFLCAADIRAERLARQTAAAAASNRGHPLLRLFDDHISFAAPTPQTARFYDTPERLLGSVALVLKAPAANEKGVLLLQYSYTFPLFAQRFDLNKIAERYYFVLEPDWSGYCDLNILSYCRYSFPVFVQAFEPRDAKLITITQSNLIPVPVSTNWWVDHRIFHPMPGVKKDIDVVMVAGWGHYKRHAAFFAGLRRLRNAGRPLRVLLLGYPLDSCHADILRQAQYYGVDDMLEMHESVPYEGVNEFVNRAKVSVIWSRREGVNRAIIECMFAGVPCLVRAGLNYGYHYPYINATTGCFANERELPEKLLWMIDNHSRYLPREWVFERMTCQRATELLSEVIGATAAARGESWSGQIAVKVNKLHGVEYWDPENAHRFEPDYSFLRSAVR